MIQVEILYFDWSFSLSKVTTSSAKLKDLLRFFRIPYSIRRVFHQTYVLNINLLPLSRGGLCVNTTNPPPAGITVNPKSCPNNFLTFFEKLLQRSILLLESEIVIYRLRQEPPMDAEAQ